MLGLGLMQPLDALFWNEFELEFVCGGGKDFVCSRERFGDRRDVFVNRVLDLSKEDAMKICISPYMHSLTLCPHLWILK